MHLSHLSWHTVITVLQFHIIYSQVLASIIHPRTSHITFRIIHISFPYYKYVRSRQELRLDSLSGNSPFPARPNRADGRTNQRVRFQWHVPHPTISAANMPDITQAITGTSNIISEYQAQSPPAYNTKPSNATYICIYIHVYIFPCTMDIVYFDEVHEGNGRLCWMLIILARQW